jgi:Ricin-type beta-trefoil lectin domain-like
LKPLSPLSFAGMASTIACLLPAAAAHADSDWWTNAPYLTGLRLVQNEPVEGGVMYARIIRLQHNGAANGRLLATYEHFPNNFIIYSSLDDGITWKVLSTVAETFMPAPWAFEGEPHFYELPQATGGLPAGTMLLAGSAVRSNPKTGKLMQRLEVYYSTDQGLTWKYRGTAEATDGSKRGIWEPNLQLAANGNLVMYYSDERWLPKYDQVLAERVSPDGGLTWGLEKYVVAVPDGIQRPGMAVTQRISANLYVMSYEWVNDKGANPAYIRFSTDGIRWGDPSDRGIPVKAANGSYIGATPYCLWMPVGGPKGTIFVNGRTLTGSPNSDREIFMNSNLGVGPWQAMPAPVQWQGGYQFSGWSMGMIPTADGLGIIQMATSNAGNNTCECLIGREPLLLPGQNYQWVNQNSHLLLSVPRDSSDHGTLLTQQTLANAPGQTWSPVDVGNENFLLTNPFSGLTLDDFGWATALGSPVAVWDQNGFTVQQWQARPTGTGAYKLVNVFSNLLVGIENASLADGAGALLWNDSGTADHHWIPIPSSFATAAGLFLSQSTVKGGTAISAQFCLGSIAPKVQSLTVTPSSGKVSTPPNLALLPNANSVYFKLTTRKVTTTTKVRITATTAGQTRTATLTLLP